MCAGNGNDATERLYGNTITKQSWHNSDDALRDSASRFARRYTGAGNQSATDRPTESDCTLPCGRGDHRKLIIAAVATDPEWLSEREFSGIQAFFLHRWADPEDPFSGRKYIAGTRAKMKKDA